MNWKGFDQSFQDDNNFGKLGKLQQLAQSSTKENLK